MHAPPRDRATRIEHTLERLETDVDMWVATGGDARDPHLTPLSFLWDEGTLIVATPTGTPTARNLLAGSAVRCALGGTRDCVVIDCSLVASIGVEDIPASTAALFARKAGFDPRRSSADFRYFRLQPLVVRAWREENELRDRVIMRNGHWSDSSSR